MISCENLFGLLNESLLKMLKLIQMYVLKLEFSVQIENSISFQLEKHPSICNTISNIKRLL